MTVLRSGSATDVGRVRKINQDLPLETANLFAVADGMGGHVGGEVAAKVAVDALLRVFSREPTRAGLEAAFEQANRAVWQESQDHGELRGMGTTLTAAALVGGADGRDILALANVGDSRAYLFSENQIVQVTADHSLAEERMRQGEMTEAEAAVHPQRHILTRALGVASDVETDMWELHVRSGDRLVLCSDGLSNELGRDQIVDILSSVPDPEDAARHLVDAANEHGGLDNITVVVVDVLVGEDDPGGSQITPIGVRAGIPLVVLDGTVHPATSAALAGTLAEGTGLTSHVAAVVGDQARPAAERPLEDTQAVPVARTTVRSVVTPAPPVSAGRPKETRRQRRRRLGIPHRITVRVILFILLVAAIPTGAYYAIRWYAYDNWYLSVQKNEAVVLQGHEGGVLWFHPKVVDHTHLAPSTLTTSGVGQIRSPAGVQEPSLAAAKRYVNNLHDEYLAAQAVKRAKKVNPPTGKGPDSGPGATVPTSTTSTLSTATTTTLAAPGTVP